MVKQYTNPKLLVFSINKRDLIVTSPKYDTSAVAGSGDASNGGVGFAPDRNDWTDGE